jgi:hypothetical protein
MKKKKKILNLSIIDAEAKNWWSASPTQKTPHYPSHMRLGGTYHPTAGFEEDKNIV